MKIVCNQKEFAALVRECYRCAREEACAGCPFASICTAGDEPMYDDQIMSRIEDICEIEVGAGG